MSQGTVEVRIPGPQGGTRSLSSEEYARWNAAWYAGWRRDPNTFAEGSIEAEGYQWGAMDRSLQ